MNTEVPKDTSHELFVLSFIVELCNQEPSDQLLLDDMLMFLRAAQESDVIDNLPIGHEAEPVMGSETSP